MSVRVWNNLQQHKSNRTSGWQLVGRGEGSDAPKDDGRTVRPLTYSEITAMSAADAEWHVQHNKKNWELAFEEQERRRTGKQHLAKTKVELCWSGHSTAEEDELAYRAGNEFALRTPTFPRTNEAAILVANYMKENLMDATRVDSYVKAFRQLVEDRKIQPLAYQSADTFYSEHKELHPTQVPPLIQAKEAKAKATEEHFAKAQAASARAGSTTVVDYEAEQTGYPQAPTKYSFRRLLDSLSADEYQRRVSEDPAFAAAIDKLNNGKR